MNAVLGIDLGDNCGWCSLDVFPERGYVLRHGVWRLKPTRFETASNRFDVFERRLREHIVLGVTHCAFETVHRHNGTAAAHVYGGYLATLQRVCEAEKIPLKGYAVQTIKKFATGKGNASKDQMKYTATSAVGFEIEDDNEADAIHIARLHWENL